MKDHYDLKHAIRYFEYAGFCAVPREYRESFEKGIKSLGLSYSSRTVDVVWKCWIYQTEEYEHAVKGD